MPAFEGDIRDYPRFESDFQRQVMPEIKKQEMVAYVLKPCLMWKRLDEKYGKTSKLRDVVMYDIKSLKAVREGDDKKFIQLINIMERGYRDLARLGVQYEILNSTTVSLIEEKLPRDIWRDWSKEVNRTDNKVYDANKFRSLLEFLLKQKRII